MNASTDSKIEVLSNRMLKLLTNKPYNANRNHINKIAAQIKYLTKFVGPKDKEAEV